MTRRGIVLAGTVILDIVQMIDRWPVEEQVALIKETHVAAGGPPHNAAAGLLKLGADFPVTCIGVVGDDPYADQLRNSAKSYGIDTSHIRSIKNAITCHTQVMTSLETGKRTFFLRTGVNSEIKPEWLMPQDDAAKIYYLGSPGIASGMDNTNGWETALHAATARGFKTALELVPVPGDIQKKFVTPLLPHVDILVINDSEAEAVSGRAVINNGTFDANAALYAADELIKLGVREVVAIHHPKGAVVATKDGRSAKAGTVKVPQSDIIGSVGAGDAFYAGFLLGWHDHKSLEDCLALANASAATSLASPTTSQSIKPWKEALTYAAKCGLREF